jgi:hypothetical protein
MTAAGGGRMRDPNVLVESIGIDEKLIFEKTVACRS